MSDRCSDGPIRMQYVATGPYIHPACHADRIPLVVGYLPGLFNILWYRFILPKRSGVLHTGHFGSMYSRVPVNTHNVFLDFLSHTFLCFDILQTVEVARRQFRVRA